MFWESCLAASQIARDALCARREKTLCCALSQCVAMHVSACTRRPARCDPSLPRPRLYWYRGLCDASTDHCPLPPWKNESNWQWRSLRRLIESSAYHEADGACADFFLISNHVDYKHGGRYDVQTQNSTKLVQMFQHVARQWPWWNHSVVDQRRDHLLLTPCDHGPGDCMYSSEWAHKHNHERAVPEELKPDGLRRLVGYLTPTGAHGATAWFREGLDVRLPQDETRTHCGPFCGIPNHLRSRLGINVLREHSPWAYRDKRRDRRLARARPIQFFWSGWSSSTKGFRGGLMHFHLNRSRWLLRDTSPSGRKSGRGSAIGLGASGLVDSSSASWMARSMASSDFCYAPLGQHHGDSDRYLPALLYGCVPVFIKEDEAGPFREVIPWANISLMLTPSQLPILHEVLGNISQERLVAMRTAMVEWWSRMLWPRAGALDRTIAMTAFREEKTQHNAFTTFVEVLRRRLDASSCAMQL